MLSILIKQIVQSLYYLNPKFQAYGHHLVWPYSPVCVGPAQKPPRQFFSHRGSNALLAQSVIKFTINNEQFTINKIHVMCVSKRNPQFMKITDNDID